MPTPPIYHQEKAKYFYDREYRDTLYSNTQEVPARYREVEKFVVQYALENARCLEVGGGRGSTQDLCAQYFGIDLAESIAAYFHKPFATASATELPFADGSFDAIWSVTVLEHVHYPEQAMQEIRRVLKPDGFLLFAPAWYCRPWAAQGYPIRNYRDLSLKGKLIKASIPLREATWFRALSVFPRRLLRHLTHKISPTPTAFHYRELSPNFETFWMADSDAINSMDPHEAILWFTSRGDRCLSHPTSRAQFLVRTGALVFQVKPTTSRVV